MDFYEEWENCVQNQLKDDYYINSFLYHSVDSVKPLDKSSKNRVNNIIEFLLSYDKKKIISKIDFKHEKIIAPCDVIQFSSFNKATSEITHLLKYENDGLTFEELGYLLNSAPNKLAATKYGENHAKTARIFSLVNFSNTRPIIVTNTSLGNSFPLLNEDKQKKLLSILSLRDPLVKCYISKMKYIDVSIDDLLSCLSKTTFERRKNNVNTLISLALFNIQI